MTAPTVPMVYRAYDRDGRLLYVGSTGHLKRRMTDHRRRAEWYALMDHVATEEFDTIQQARAAETAAIRAEQPLHNITHRGPAPEELRQRAEWVAEQVAKAPPLTGGRRDRLVELLAGAR